MKKVIETLKLLLWGNLAALAMVLYAMVVVFVQITIFFIVALGEIWNNED